MNIHAFQPIFKVYKETNVDSIEWYTSSVYFLTTTGSPETDNNFTITANTNYEYGIWGFTTGSWLSYPANAQLDIIGEPIPYALPYSTTRNSLYASGGMAIAWGSFVCDMLWNATSMQWTTPVSVGVGTHYLSYNSTSSFFASASPHLDPVYPRGNASNYDITSSWHAVDYRLLNMIVSASTQPNLTSLTLMTAQGSPQRVTQSIYVFKNALTYTASFFEDPPPLLGSPTINLSSSIGYTLDYQSGSYERNIGFDRQFFDVGQGVGITRADISQSLTTMSWDGYGPLGVSVQEDPNKPGSYNGNTAAGRLTQSIALKKRRLYYPTEPIQKTISSIGFVGLGAFGSSNANDYYHYRLTGYKANEVFTENGGIYNVQFTLKKYAPVIPTTSIVPFNYSPSANSFLAVFIHDVRSTPPASSSRTLGDSGWYPPLNNIVIIGNNYTFGTNTTPEISFFDPNTGFTHEKFNFNLVQYGYPAQLCFEACGDWSTGAAFGIIISDVKICKIGVSTDPNFVKPISALTTLDSKKGPLGVSQGDPVSPPPAGGGGSSRTGVSGIGSQGVLGKAQNK